MQPKLFWSDVIFVERLRFYRAPDYTLKKLLLNILLLLSAANLFAQSLGAPYLYCISTNDAGDVNLTWAPPTDPNNVFDSWTISTSISPGIPFSPLASIPDYAVNNITFLGLGNNNDHYFYIQTVSSDGSVSAPSDTLRNIYLQAVPAGNNCVNCDSSVYLNWNHPFMNASYIPADAYYEIWTDYPTGTWVQLTTLPSTSNTYIDIVENCAPVFMNFQVRLIIPQGCTYYSNIAGDFFADNTHPSTSYITAVSTDINGDGSIQWDASQSDDTDGYWIYECDGGNTSIIQYVNGGATSEFIDLLAQPNAGPLSYAIAAVDVCGNADTTICATSMFLQVLPYQECDDHVDLSWTPYFSWNTPPSYYVIHRALSADNQYSNDVYFPIDTVNGTNVLNYADHQFLPGGWNFYRIEAVDTVLNHRAFSNIRGVQITDEVPPSFVRISSVQVVSEDQIEVQLSISPTTSTFRYVLQRFDEDMLEWDEVMTYDVQNASQISFQDVELATDVFAYTYRVMVFNLCGVLKDTSNTATSILLQGLASQELLANNLVWSGFSYWPEGIDGYDVMRRVGRLGEEEFIIEILPGADLRYEDDLSDLTDTEGEFCYRIDATMAGPDGTIYRSKSNEICLSLEPVIWVPTAMMIGGNNDEFFPVISYADLSTYHLVVYSRWGDILFETRNIEEHWDGKLNDKVVPNDVYMYSITVDDGKGQAIQRSGTLTVLVY